MCIFTLLRSALNGKNLFKLLEQSEWSEWLLWLKWLVEIFTTYFKKSSYISKNLLRILFKEWSKVISSLLILCIHSFEIKLSIIQ